jgi:hypothetical protein
MAVCSVYSTRIATAAPKPATATFIVISNGNTNAAYFQDCTLQKPLEMNTACAKEYTDSCLLLG